jgi:transglutaminase-like putative cysteine protease
MPAPKPPQSVRASVRARTVPAHGDAVRSAPVHGFVPSGAHASAPSSAYGPGTRTSSAAPTSAAFFSRVRSLPADSGLPRRSLIRDGLLSLLLFLLMWEWLRPMPQLSDAPELSIMPFLIVLGICILLDCLKAPYKLGWLLKCTALVALIGYLFYPNAFTDITWFWDYALLMAQDGMHIAQGHLARVSAQSRTALFMIGWMLMLSVAGALMLQRQRALWIVAGTLVYLIVLQLMLGMDTTLSIIRTWGISLLLFALLNLPRIERVYGFKSKTAGWPARWVAVSLLVVVLTAGLGWLGLQSQTVKLMKPIDGTAMLQRWENYVWQQPYGQDKTGAVVSRSGYGDDDSSLGGRLIPDNSLIFTATTAELSYWRGESKAIYTGKGWIGTEPQGQTFEPDKSYGITGSEAFTQQVSWNNAKLGKQIFYSGRLAHVDAMLSNQGVTLPSELLLWDTDNGKASLAQIADPITYYEITVQPIREDPSLLLKDKAPYPPMIEDTYLQLPKLPPTIRQLSERITDGLDGNYAKAAAIEQYLRSTYKYSLDQSTIPLQNEDFVSHFLFVDQNGYCDHFSTTMAVMLRSIGIPARWVKGFSAGEPVTPVTLGEQTVQLDSSKKTVQVRGKDAHSWVEVYFPSAGWIPFEPTPGFAEQIPELRKETGTVPKTIVEQLIAAALSLPDLMASAALNQAHWQWLGVSAGSLGVLLALLLLFRKTRRLQPAATRAPAVPVTVFHDRIRLMDRLWLKVFRLFGVKPIHQTLREYIGLLKVAEGAQRQALFEFLRLYEGLRYDREERHYVSRKQIWEIWKSIKNKGAR